VENIRTAKIRQTLLNLMAARRSATDQKKFLAHLDKLFQNPDKERLGGFPLM
jgi:hypothetical protein